MKFTHSIALAGLLVALILGGFTIDNAMANNTTYYCGTLTTGCPTIPCSGIPGNCANGAGYLNIYQNGYTYYPCNASTGPKCPSPLNVYWVCFSAGANPTVTQPCGTIVCSVWTWDYGC